MFNVAGLALSILPGRHHDLSFSHQSTGWMEGEATEMEEWRSSWIWSADFRGSGTHFDVDPCLTRKFLRWLFCHQHDNHLRLKFPPGGGQETQAWLRW